MVVGTLVVFDVIGSSCVGFADVRPVIFGVTVDSFAASNVVGAVAVVVVSCVVVKCGVDGVVVDSCVDVDDGVADPLVLRDIDVGLDSSVDVLDAGVVVFDIVEGPFVVGNVDGTFDVVVVPCVDVLDVGLLT